MKPNDLLDRIDVWHQRHGLLVFPVGVYLRYREDRGNEYARRFIPPWWLRSVPSRLLS